VIAYWMLVAASGVQAAAFAFYMPARIALISEVVPTALLQNAVVLSQTSQEAMRVIAPALAGVLIGVSAFGVGGVFISAGVASAVALGLILRLPQPAERPVLEPRSPLREIGDAITYMRATPGLGAIGLLTVGVVMVAFPYLTFLPTLADERFDVGAVGYGLMSTAAGLGALAAGLFSAALNKGLRPWRTIAGSSAALGVTVGLLGMAESFVLGLVAIAGIGASGLVFQTSTQAQMLRISAPEYHGRLQSMVILGFSGFGLAALPLGLVADAISLRTTLACMGGLVLAMTAVFALLHRRAGARANDSVPLLAPVHVRRPADEIGH
jgi:MFS family permease